MNTIRDLKQQEKYKTMLKRKNKEKKIYKDKNASLQFEKQRLYRALLNREKEIERLKQELQDTKEHLGEYLHEQEEENKRLNKGIKELDNMFYETFRISQNGYYSISEWVLKEFTDKIKELKGVDKE